MKLLLIIAAVCFIAGFLMLLVFGVGFARAQTSLSDFPDHDVAYSCLPTLGNGPAFTVQYTSGLFPAVKAVMGTVPASNDVTAPIIANIANSAGIDLTTGAVKLLAVNNGLAVTVTATDNIGIVGGKLEFDGITATPFGNGLEILPNLFYVRWNSKTIGIGTHVLRLTVCDAAANCTMRSWNMQK